jgi:hypothetical protein
MKTYLILLMTFCLVFASHARLTEGLPYDAQNDKAALVVIATPTTVAETSELVALPNIVTVHNDGTKEDVMGKGVETTFDVLTVLKGERATKTLVLHHFKLAKPGVGFNDPMLVSFKPQDKKRYLMFLQKEADGRYVAVCGQTDPAYSIKELVDNYP